MGRPTLLPAVFVLAAALTGCGAGLQNSVLGSADEAQAPKVSCPGAHDGFYVCMSTSTHISDPVLEATMKLALAKLASVVNSVSFQSTIESSFPTGTSIVGDLSATDYIVDIQGYCNAKDDALAKAPVGGASIEYNECRVERDASGQYDLAQVAGVLLHEIAHNIGYTHPDVNPSRLTAPYFVGDLAESLLAEPSSAPKSAGSAEGDQTPRPRQRSSLGY